MSRTIELWTDGIVTLGAVRRVYFHALIEVNGQREWWYFGTDPEEKPPTQDYPVNETAYVQFPDAFMDLGDEMTPTLYDLGQRAGYNREGLT